jgi:ankyrin repeat protein
MARYVDKKESNLNGQSAIHLVVCFPKGDNEGQDFPVLISLLTQCGANPNAQDNNGNTLMHHYARKCVDEAVAFYKNISRYPRKHRKNC